MKNKNIVPLLLIAGASYYFYMQSKKNQNIKTKPIETSDNEVLQVEIVPEQKPKTLLAKASALVKKAANTPEGKSLISKGKKALTKKLKLKQLGATYL